LLAAALLIMFGVAGVLAIAGIRHFAGVHGPVLPVAWCRGGNETPLPPLTGMRWATSWQPDWIALVFVAGLASMYMSGVAAVRRRRNKPWPRRHTIAFLAGLGVVVAATSGSIGVYDMAMFSTHMIGHLAFVMLAPPLLVLGRPMTLVLHATRAPWHQRFRRVLRSRPVALWFSAPVALASYAVVIVGTHLTGLMDVIMTRPWAGQLEHLVYLAVGYQFFVLVVGDEPLRWRLTTPARWLLLAVAMAVDTFTGVILIQTRQAVSMMGLSPAHVDPLIQTHLGGAIMWVGGDGIMAVTMFAITAAWLRRGGAQRGMRRGWLEQTRRATLIEHTIAVPGAGDSIGHDIDEDDTAREAYNRWLEHLSRTGR
jgi:putative copper resistance protein D